MSAYTKKFYTTSSPDNPLQVEFDRLLNTRRKNLPAIRKFLKKYKVENIYGHTPEHYKFDLTNGYDETLWSKTKPVRGQYFFKPRKNTEGGKALAKVIAALPEYPLLGEAINVVPGLKHNRPMVFAECHVYYPFIKHASKTVIIVQVPTGGSETTEWSPPDYLTEIKEWEALKAIEEST